MGAASCIRFFSIVGVLGLENSGPVQAVVSAEFPLLEKVLRTRDVEAELPHWDELEHPCMASGDCMG